MRFSRRARPAHPTALARALSRRRIHQFPLMPSKFLDTFRTVTTTTTTRTVDRTAELFRALADPTRLMILSELRAGERCVCELADRFETGQSRLSFHMKTLKDAGVVTDRRDGRWIYYALNPAALDEACALVGMLRTARGTRLAAPVRRTEGTRGRG